MFLSLSRALYINLVCLWAISICSVFCGLCLYSFYKNCDPWTARKVSALDQVQTTAMHLKCNKITVHVHVIKTPDNIYMTLLVNSEYATLMFLSIICNKLMPYLVLDILSEYPGVPGLFVAAAYSGTLRFVLC